METTSIMTETGSVDAAGINGKNFETRTFTKGCLGLTTLSPIDLLFSGRLVDGCCGVKFYEGCFMPCRQDVIIAGVYEGDVLLKVAWIRPATPKSPTSNVGGSLIEAVDQSLAGTLLAAGAEGIDFSSGADMGVLS